MQRVHGLYGRGQLDAMPVHKVEALASVCLLCMTTSMSQTAAPSKPTLGDIADVWTLHKLWQRVAGGIVMGVGGLFLLVAAILYATLGPMDPESMPLRGHFIYVMLAGFGALVAVGGAVAWWGGARARRWALDTLQHGARHDAKVVSNTQNFYRQVERIPERVVVLDANGETLTMRFFNERLAQHMPKGAVIPVCVGKGGHTLPAPALFE